MAITEGTAVKDEQEEKVASEETEDVTTPTRDHDYDVLRALIATGHHVCEYPNGLVLGVHIEGIPGRRGVHVDSVYVLDLRRASFGTARLAMQAAVLETINRDMCSVLQDIEMDYTLTTVSKRTTKGKLILPMLKANQSHPGTMVHNTRTVYVVTGNERPKLDLSWLTEPSRVLHADDFLLARRSDMRSFLSEMQNRVLLDKWELLGDSIRQGWFGLLSLVFASISAFSLIAALMVPEGIILIPTLATALGGILGLWMIDRSRKNLDEFNVLLREEEAKTNRVGDGHRIDASISENEEKLKLQRDLGFVISPLLASVAGSISIGDYDDAVSSACLVLDECVRFSQADGIPMGDEGLAKFIGLFESFNAEFEEAELSICYAGLTNHLVSPLGEEEILRQCTVLSDSLYNVGILKPTVKDRIDDLMNQRALKENLRYLDHAIDVDNESHEEGGDGDDDSWFTDEMLQENLASKEEFDSIPVLIAYTHPDDLDEDDMEQTAKQLDDLSVAATQTSPPDDVEMTASDVVNSAHSNKGSRNLDDKEDSLEDDIPAR
ncbi:MAG: hypothetical protein ACFFDR_01970 [Candidatus Thorarchaeota archaeon]